MIFFDATAAAKRYFLEVGSDRVNALWSGRDEILSLTLLQCELVSALNRKRRERVVPHAAHRRIRKQMGEDAGKMQTVPINAELIERSLKVLDAHPLKALDSLYLAGALYLQEALRSPVLFVAADHQLLRAAQSEGLQVLNPEAGP